MSHLRSTVLLAVASAALLVPAATANTDIHYFGQTAKGQFSFQLDPSGTVKHVHNFHFITRCGAVQVQHRFPVTVHNGKQTFHYRTHNGNWTITGELDVNGPGSAAGTVSDWRAKVCEHVPWTAHVRR